MSYLKYMVAGAILANGFLAYVKEDNLENIHTLCTLSFLFILGFIIDMYN